MTLKEQLLAENVRPLVVADCITLVDSEVASKGGITGFAIKSGFKVVKRLDGGRLLPKAVNDLLPEFAEAVEPEYERFKDSGSNDFVEFCRGREGVLADALLAVTDEKAVHAKNTALKGVYNKLRPMAKRNIESAIPGLAAIVQRHSQ